MFQVLKKGRLKMRGLKCLTPEGLMAFNRGDLICLGSFATRGLDKKSMLRELNKRKCVGSWCPNIFDNSNFSPTKFRNFRLVAVCKPVSLERQWERKTADDLALSFGFGNNKLTIEMAYYLWEARFQLRKLSDHREDISCLVVCHHGVHCGRDVCDRIVVINDRLVISGGISGPGHGFGDNAGYVYTIPC